jgi:hypothetical protein
VGLDVTLPSKRPRDESNADGKETALRCRCFYAKNGDTAQQWVPGFTCTDCRELEVACGVSVDDLRAFIPEGGVKIKVNIFPPCFFYTSALTTCTRAGHYDALQGKS